MEWITDLETWIALATLTFLEIVLGVDNIIFISILSGKLPEGQQLRARRLGLLGAMLTRVLLLFSLAWIIKLSRPLFTALGHGVTGREEYLEKLGEERVASLRPSGPALSGEVDYGEYR